MQPRRGKCCSRSAAERSHRARSRLTRARRLLGGPILATELDAVRERGYAYNFGEREDDLHAVAAPIWGSNGELAAIIGVQGPATRFDGDAMEAAVEPLLAHARDVSLELGWTGLVRERVR